MSTATNGTDEAGGDSSSSSGVSSTVQELYSGGDGNGNGGDDNPTGVLIGYACQQVVTQNVVNDFEVTFFTDMSSQIGEQPFTVQHVQQALVLQMGRQYGISDGVRCSQLPVDGSTWVVQFEIDPSAFVQVDIFDGCRELSWDPTTQDCYFYEVTVKGSYMGASNQEFADIVSFLKQQFSSTSLVQDLNDAAALEESGGVDIVDNTNNNTTTTTTLLYQTAFLGVPVPDDSTNVDGSDGRDNLNDPTNIETTATASPSQSDRTTITIVGGLLVAAFGCAFIGILYILWRRRQYYIQSQQVHMSSLDKMSVIGGGDDNYDDDGHRGGGGGATDAELGPYNNTSNTDLEEEDYEDGQREDGDNNNNNNYGHEYDKGHRMMASSQQQDNKQHEQHVKDDIDDDSESSSTRSPNALNPMQFDLGNSFKDQLMGVYGARSGGGGPATGGGGQGNNNNNRGSNNGLTGSVLFPAAYSVDGDSDADSWAQTDGTIGSLELQLEPITAEV